MFRVPTQGRRVQILFVGLSIRNGSDLWIRAVEFGAVDVGGASETGRMNTFPFPPGAPQTGSLAAAVSALSGVDLQIRALEARKASLLAEVDRLAEVERGRFPSDSRSAEMVYRAAAAEVGVALGIADRTAERLIDQAGRLCRDYPEVRSSLAAGRIQAGQATAIVDAGAVIDRPESRGAYTSEVLAIAETETPNRTRRFAKILAEKHAGRTFEQRHERAHQERRVWISDLADGMAEFHLVTDAVSAHAAYDRLSRLARELQKTDVAAQKEALACAGARGTDARVEREDGDSAAIPQPRSVDQLRADLAADTLLNGAPSNERGEIGFSRIDARVQVVVPVLGLLAGDSRGGEAAQSSLGREGSRGRERLREREGLRGAEGSPEPQDPQDLSHPPRSPHRPHSPHPGPPRPPAMLAGYGPIDAATTRLLMSLATGWDRVGCHPETGEVLRVDRYRPSEEIRRFLRARDQHCRYPGCTVVPFRADNDHTIDAALGGATSTENLSVLCRRHHMMKHHAGVSMTQSSGGDIEWTTPLGRRVADRPPSRVVFRPVAEEQGRRTATPRAA